MKKKAKSKIFQHNFLEKNRKAELTTQQIITLIILIVSFAIILIFIFRLNLGGEATNKEICHNSVLMKSKQSFGGALDCRTSYVCISGGEKCEDFSATETVKVDLNKKDQNGNSLAKDEVMKAIAKEMADCWWMFGEGKVDYVDKSIWDKIIGVFKGDKVCALCSRIKFSNDIKTEVGAITQDIFRDILASAEKSKGVSYLYYLYSTNDKNKITYDVNLKEEYYVLTGIAEEGVSKKIWETIIVGAIPSNLIFVDSNGKQSEKGPLPVKLVKKSELDKESCSDFITKS